MNLFSLFLTFFILAGNASEAFAQAVQFGEGKRIAEVSLSKYSRTDLNWGTVENGDATLIRPYQSVIASAGRVVRIAQVGITNDYICNTFAFSSAEKAKAFQDLMTSKKAVQILVLHKSEDFEDNIYNCKDVRPTLVKLKFPGKDQITLDDYLASVAPSSLEKLNQWASKHSVSVTAAAVTKVMKKTGQDLLSSTPDSPRPANAALAR